MRSTVPPARFPYGALSGPGRPESRCLAVMCSTSRERTPVFALGAKDETLGYVLTPRRDGYLAEGRCLRSRVLGGTPVLVRGRLLFLVRRLLLSTFVRDRGRQSVVLVVSLVVSSRAPVDALVIE